MKAKEYAEKLWQSKDFDSAIAEIGREFIKETVVISELRHVKLGMGFANVVKELNQKWIKFAEIVNTKYYPTSEPIKYDGYLNLLMAYSPETYMEYKNNLN
jgi:hypothetical protein